MRQRSRQGGPGLVSVLPRPCSVEPWPSTIVWLRDDLRLDDNPALAAAARSPEKMTVVYVLDEDSPGIRPLGGAARWWLHHSLSALSAELESKGSRLLLRRGAAAPASGNWPTRPRRAPSVWNRRMAIQSARMDAGLKEWATGEGIEATSFQASLLFEPWTVRPARAGRTRSSRRSGVPAWPVGRTTVSG